MTTKNEYVGSKIIKLNRGEAHLGREKNVYAVLVDREGSLLISATLEYITDVLPERLPPSARERGKQILAKIKAATDNGDYSDSPAFY